jgi:hypothetical protein
MTAIGRRRPKQRGHSSASRTKVRASSVARSKREAFVSRGGRGDEGGEVGRGAGDEGGVSSDARKAEGGRGNNDRWGGRGQRAGRSGAATGAGTTSERPGVVGREHTVSAYERLPGRRHERAQTRQALDRCHHAVGVAPPVRCFELVGDSPIAELREAFEGEGRPGAVAKEPFAPLAIVGGEAHPRVQVEPRVLGVTGASASRGKGRVVAATFFEGLPVEASEEASPRDDLKTSLGRRRRSRLVRSVRVGIAALAVAAHPAAEALGDAPDEAGDGFGGRRSEGHERDAGTALGEDAVGGDDMKMDVQIERAAEALHEGDGAALADDLALLAGLSPVQGDDHALGEAGNGPAHS